MLIGILKRLIFSTCRCYFIENALRKCPLELQFCIGLLIDDDDATKNLVNLFITAWEKKGLVNEEMVEAVLPISPVLSKYLQSSVEKQREMELLLTETGEAEQEMSDATEQPLCMEVQTEPIAESQALAAVGTSDTPVTKTTLISYIVSGMNTVLETCRSMNPAQLLAFFQKKEES